MSPADYEVGFSMLVWVSTKLAGSLEFVQFCIQAMTIVPIFIAVRTMGSKISLSYGMLIYYLLYFNASLNIMRQWIAVAFTLLAIVYLLNRRYALYGIYTLIALCFHTSALISVIIGALYIFLNGGSGATKFLKNKAYLVMVIAAVLVVFGGAVLSSLLNMLGLSYYIQYIGTSGISISPSQLAILGPLVLLVVLFVNHYRINNPSVMFLYTLLVLGLIVSQFASVTDQSNRIALYFNCSSMLLLPLCMSRIGSKRGKVLFAVSTVAYCLTYWCVIYAFLGANQTVPYIAA